MSMDSWFPNPHDKDISQLEEGLAYRAVKSGNNWILPSGKNAANGDPVVLDGVFGYATAAIVGGTDAIVEDTNWKPYGDGGALGAIIGKFGFGILKDVVATTSGNANINLNMLPENTVPMLLWGYRASDGEPVYAFFGCWSTGDPNSWGAKIFSYKTGTGQFTSTQIHFNLLYRYIS